MDPGAFEALSPMRRKTAAMLVALSRGGTELETPPARGSAPAGAPSKRRRRAKLTPPAAARAVDGPVRGGAGGGSVAGVPEAPTPPPAKTRKRRRAVPGSTAAAADGSANAPGDARADGTLRFEGGRYEVVSGSPSRGLLDVRTTQLGGEPPTPRRASNPMMTIGYTPPSRRPAQGALLALSPRVPLRLGDSRAARRRRDGVSGGGSCSTSTVVAGPALSLSLLPATPSSRGALEPLPPSSSGGASMKRRNIAAGLVGSAKRRRIAPRVTVAWLPSALRAPSVPCVLRFWFPKPLGVGRSRQQPRHQLTV